MNFRLFVLATLLTTGLSATASAQVAHLANEPFSCHLASGKNIQREFVKPLRSSSDDVRAEALSKTIVYATHYKEMIDLTPTVRALLDIYREDRNPQFRLMAVHALYQVGNTRGLAELYELSERDRRSPRVQKAAQYAAKRHFADLQNRQALEYHQKMADRHTQRAEKYRKRTG